MLPALAIQRLAGLAAPYLEPRETAARTLQRVARGMIARRAARAAAEPVRFGQVVERAENN